MLDPITIAALERPITDGLKQFCADPLGISFADRSIKDFAYRAFKSALSARKNISKTTRAECFHEAVTIDGIKCYSCGIVLSTRVHRSLSVSLDHLWPRAYGGSSDAVNLLPVCETCNAVKADRITWDVFGVVNDYSLMKHGQNALLLTKMALHRKAATKLAEDRLITLKEAFIHLGAYTELGELDPAGKDFFFDLRAHDLSVLLDLW